jgi:hypothetical protein
MLLRSLELDAQESLEWESLANGLWTHPGTHLLSWKGNSATGAGGPVSLTALPLDAVKKTKIEPIGVQSVVRRDHQRSPSPCNLHCSAAVEMH